MMTTSWKDKKNMLLTFGLFESAADACAAIRDLVKANFNTDHLWLIARDLKADTGEQNDRRITIAQVIVALDLATTARYFKTTGLVLIPEEGTYLAAGWPAHELTRVASVADDNQTELCRTLTDLGCTSDEAGFLDGRLQAGSLLLGVIDASEARLGTAREIFTEQQAIHVGAAAIPDATWESLNSATIPKPDANATRDAVVLDFSTLLVLGEGDDGPDDMPVGSRLFDEQEAEIGMVTGVAIDSQAGHDIQPRYIIVENGGFLGVGRSEYVIPMDLVEGDSGSGRYRVRLTRDLLEKAPAFDPELPISRREELSICGYYGTAPYWET